MVSLAEIREASEVLARKVIRTPLIYSPVLSSLTGAEVYLKLENLQKTGSFKIRGATYKIHKLGSRIGASGVVAGSAGNHAQGVALAAREAGLPATIVMPEWASISKQQATAGYGGEVILFGQSVDESIVKAKELANAGKTFIHPYDDTQIMAGQGTIGLEILQELPDPDMILVPVGGGGLIGGIATAVKSLHPKTRMIGVEAAACPSAHRSLQAGGVTRIEPQKSIADGIAIKQVGEITFSVMQDKVDSVVLVEEDQIAAAVLMLLERKKILAEGAGAVPLAALLSGAVETPKGAKIVLVISGGNMDSPLLDRVIRHGLFRNGRIMRFSVCLHDIPGSLAKLLTLVGDLQANVMHIDHDRIGRDLPIQYSRVDLELETRGPDHIEKVAQALREAGYHVQ
jgi:threonine dehydratase